MFAILIFLDLTLAVLQLVAAPLLWVRTLAALAAGRLAVALGLLTGGLLLADSRLSVQVPLALIPALFALWRPGRTSARVSAAGAVLSVWWLLVPFPPEDTVLVLAGSAAVLGLIVVLSARPLSLALVFLLVPAASLTAAATASASGGHRHDTPGRLSVDRLTGPEDQTPDVRTTLTAARTGDRLTFNGTSPGPEIRAKVGQLVEVTLLNRDVDSGVTLHWHGVDVPNAEDGVPGVTQDAVPPGGRHVYRFVPTRSGTFWYHTHRDALHNVEKGLFGAFIVDDAPFGGFERVLFTHHWAGTEDVPAGREVRLRTVNSSAEPRTVQVAGADFRVTAVDGNPIQGATPLAPGTDLVLAAGGRYDLGFTMPPGPVTVALDGETRTLSPGGTAPPLPVTSQRQFDPLSYGSPSAPVATGHQRVFDLRLDDGFGFSQGRLSYVSSLINGRLYPAVPTLEVAHGDRVKVRIASRSTIQHPFHLHGHRVRVLSRNGEPSTGSPWWTDTLNVGRGELYEIEFTADNPGIWMNHCHNFQHGADGMILHLAYQGVSTPFSSDHAPE
ncbi:multicopper oxidase family protein [Actinoplanes couchii]|uniref:Multicopper oxidase type 3 n=1 Tax=Actinoplanes couchii TaxID=403638 RepID=A0ABQ3X819_9ACTN|nr:multicopper oxidase family protein [Actinoplanes couchii]MDR6320384.1 FtsP/CotA-like multicopper oxidase with cupredoxin domain [Actinoplanes couchii]GID54604.1 hypothetical protein Aco03nite_030080 [Actinoplanes couchii]